jgi:D-arabinose 1-dehydrogenase-like Zn-dependent alcohol dehydrogenase
MYKAKAYSAASAKLPMAHATLTRRDPTEYHVQIEILFCGIANSSLATSPPSAAWSTRTAPVQNAGLALSSSDRT